jgi:hypothetical protein
VATFRQLGDAKSGYWWFVLLVTAIVILAVALAESSVTASRVAQFTVTGGRTGAATQGNFNSASGNAGAAAGNPNASGNGGTGQRNAGGTGANAAGARQVQTASPLLLIGLPLAGGIAVTLLDYGLRALLVFLMSMLLGGKAAFREVFRMAAWTTLPAAVRRVVQAMAVVLTGGQIAAGFSAALSAAEIRTLPLVNLLLGYVDVYTLWSALLLGIGAVITGRLSKGKAAFTVAIYICVSLVGILVFYAVTNAIGGALGGTNTRGAGFPGGGGGRNRPGG